MLLQTMTGDETFSDGTSKYHVFVVPSRRYPLFQMRETHIGVVAKGGFDQCPVRAASAAQRLPAVAGSMVDQGTWYRSIYDVPEGMILKLFGQRSLSASRYNASRGRSFSGAMLIQMREGAALRRIVCQQVGNAKATVSQVTIEGRFDLISTKDAVEAGCQMTMVTMKSLAVDTSQLFSIHTIDKQIAAKPMNVVEKVKDDKGQDVEVQVLRPRRAIDFGD